MYQEEGSNHSEKDLGMIVNNKLGPGFHSDTATKGSCNFQLSTLRQQQSQGTRVPSL